MKKYIVTEDNGWLMGRWAEANKFCLPNPDYFTAMLFWLVSQLRLMFKYKGAENIEVESIPHHLLSSGIASRISRRSLPIVSLDRVYANGADHHIDITRIVEHDGKKWIEHLRHGPRPGFPSIEEQIQKILLSPHKAFIIVDDGCWSGNSLHNIICKLEKNGKKVDFIVVGVHIRGDHSLLAHRDLEHCHEYDRKGVLDWVSQRDFFPGIPLGGRTLGTAIDGQLKPDPRNIGVPYLLGFGDPVRWASLDFPEDMLREFTLGCLDKSIKLYEQIELASGRKVFVKDVERIPWGIEADSSVCFVDLLHEHFRRVKGF